MEKNFKIYNESLTAEAKNIFGDIVDKAYITVYCWGDTDSDIEECFKIQSEYRSDTAGNNDIYFFKDKIIIDFVNGKSVSFFSDKLANISSAKNYEEI